MPDLDKKDLTNESEQKNVPDNVDYIEAIKEIKANTVDKEAYNKLKEENKKLLDSLINGEAINQQSHVEKVDISELRKDLFNNEHSNIEYVEKALQLRDEIIKQGGKDPFLPYGEKILPTDEDIATANRVAEKLRECIEYADGNSDIFTTELQRIMIDTAPKPVSRR